MQNFFKHENYDFIGGGELPPLPSIPLGPVTSTTVPSMPALPPNIQTNTSGGNTGINWTQVLQYAQQGATWAVNLWKQQQAIKNQQSTYTPPPSTPKATTPKQDNTILYAGVALLGLMALKKNKG